MVCNTLHDRIPSPFSSPISYIFSHSAPQHLPCSKPDVQFQFPLPRTPSSSLGSLPITLPQTQFKYLLILEVFLALPMPAGFGCPVSVSIEPSLAPSTHRLSCLIILLCDTVRFLKARVLLYRKPQKLAKHGVWYTILSINAKKKK